MQLPCAHATTPPSAAAAFTAAATVAASEARALEAQTERRAARRAAREREIKERAREAAANLGSGRWKGPRTADSTNFARDFTLGIAKRVRCVLNASKVGLCGRGRDQLYTRTEHIFLSVRVTFCEGSIQLSPGNSSLPPPSRQLSR